MNAWELKCDNRLVEWSITTVNIKIYKIVCVVKNTNLDEK